MGGTDIALEAEPLKEICLACPTEVVNNCEGHNWCSVEALVTMYIYITALPEYAFDLWHGSFKVLLS